MRGHKSKKSKIGQNGLKYIKTILETLVEYLWIRSEVVTRPTRQPIFGEFDQF